MSRIFLGAFGDPGHAFPMLALGRSLAARGHEVFFETWQRWQEHVEDAGMRYVPAPEYPVFPTLDRPLKPYEAVVLAVPQTRSALAEIEPEVVVHDILTMAPSLAAELEGVPAATLIPHVHPTHISGNPPYAFGARPPRTPVGRRLWRRLDPLIQRGLLQGRDELNGARARLGLPPVQRLFGGLSQRLCLVGTFPQLEYPRRWSPEMHVVGPMLWEPPYHEVPEPPGTDPLVLVAVSTAQDPEHRLLRAAVEGLGHERVRVLAALNRKPLMHPLEVPDNAHLVEWISYARTMPRCAVVISHAGHGTMVRALASGAPVLAVPHSGDMGENAARLQWAGVGARLPWKFLTPTTVRLALRHVVSSQSMAAGARGLAAWAARHDGAERGARLVEQLAAEAPRRASRA